MATVPVNLLEVSTGTGPARSLHVYGSYKWLVWTKENETRQGKDWLHSEQDWIPRLVNPGAAWELRRRSLGLPRILQVGGEGVWKEARMSNFFRPQGLQRNPARLVWVSQGKAQAGEHRKGKNMPSRKWFLTPRKCILCRHLFPLYDGSAYHNRLSTCCLHTGFLRKRKGVWNSLLY